MIVRFWELLIGRIRTFWWAKTEQARAPLALERVPLEERAHRVEAEIRTVGRSAGAR